MPQDPVQPVYEQTPDLVADQVEQLKTIFP